MSYNLRQIIGTVRVTSLDGRTQTFGQQPGPVAIGSGSYLDAQSGACNIEDNGATAASVRGGSVEAFFPPTFALDRPYYYNSYRYKLSTPSGYIGIRG